MLVKSSFFRPQPRYQQKSRRIVDAATISQPIEGYCSQKITYRRRRKASKASLQGELSAFSERNCRRGGRTERSRELLEGDDAEPRHDGGIAEVVRGRRLS